MSKVNTINNLVEFNCIIGTDVGIIKLMEKHYKNSSYFDLHYSTENSLKNKLLWRENWNPLTIMLKKEYLDSADDLYKEAIEKYEEEIYQLSPYTDIIRYMNHMQNNELWKINCFVTCKNELQKQFVNRINDKFVSLIDQFDLTDYTTIFINEIENIATYRELKGKYIYISNYRFNLTKDWQLKPVIYCEGGFNKVRMIDPYNGLTIPTKLFNKGEITDGINN